MTADYEDLLDARHDSLVLVQRAKRCSASSLLNLAQRGLCINPQAARKLEIIAANLVDEPLGVLAADEGLDGVAERAGIREGVVDDA